MDVWKAITYVSSPLTLVAFLAAVVAWIYVSQLKRIEALVGKAKESDRAVLIEGILDVLRVDPQKLPAAKRFELAVHLIQARALKLRLAFAAFVLVTVALLVLSVVAIFNQRAEDSVNALLAGDRRTEAVAALKKHRIYPAEDAELPVALGGLTKLDAADLKLGIIDRTERLRQKIDSIPSVAELRKRAERAEAPFQPLGLKQLVGSPPTGPLQPGRYFANVPTTADYARKRIRIVEVSSGKQLILLAWPGLDDQSRDVDIHLNYRQVRHLFGGDLPTSKAEVWVQILGDGALLDPTCEPLRTVRKRNLEKKAPDCEESQQVDIQRLMPR